MLKRIILLIISCLILLYSCAEHKNDSYTDSSEAEYTESRGEYFVYNGNFYYSTGAIIYYCPIEDLDNIDEYSQCLCFDPLCEHFDSRCMAYCGGSLSFCLRKHGDTTYIYTKYVNIHSESMSEEIARFNLDTMEKTVLVSGLVNGIHTRFIVNDDCLIFQEYTGEGIHLRTYMLQSGEYYEQPIDDTSYNLIGCDGDKIYYNDLSGNIYSNSYSFDSEKLLMTGILPYGYMIYNDKLYFPYNLSTIEVEGVLFNSADIYCTPLESPSIENSYAVVHGVSCYEALGADIFDGKLYYRPADPAILGNVTVSEELGDMDFTIVDEHGGRLNVIDLKTQSESVVCDDIGYNILDLLYASDEYIIFRSTGSGYRTDIEFDSYAAIKVYERGSGELYQILYFGPDK